MKTELNNISIGARKPFPTNLFSLRGRTVLALCLLLAGVQAVFAQHYQQTNLVSDIPGLAPHTDANLVNPWGITTGPTTPWWTSNNGTGTSALYNGMGDPFPVASPLVVTIPVPLGQTGTATPTGIVFNGSADFPAAPGKPGRFIFVTEGGTVAAWNPAVDPLNAMLVVDHSSSSAVYKGATLGQMAGKNYLFVANFNSGEVEVYDGNFVQVAFPSTAFKDPSVPEGYAPFNVQNINGNILVAYAKQDDLKHDEVAGPGLGHVAVFDTAGNWLMRLKHGRWFDAPWGIVLAPTDFGKFSNHLLVGNFGSGRIAAFDPVKGNFHGLVRGHHGLPITINGLWGLHFGNGANGGPVNTLFFAAGIDDEQHGLFGTLTPIKDDETQGENQGQQ